MTYKFIYILMFTISCFILMNLKADAQFIRININIPDGFEVRDLADVPALIEPISGGAEGTSGFAGSNVRWIELRTRENTEILVRKKTTNRGRYSSAKLYFLNDGTSNFANAFELIESYNQLIMSDNMITINFNQPKYVAAWLGVSGDFSGVITIIYP